MSNNITELASITITPELVEHLNSIVLKTSLKPFNYTRCTIDLTKNVCSFRDPSPKGLAAREVRYPVSAPIAVPSELGITKLSFGVVRPSMIASVIALCHKNNDTATIVLEGIFNAATSEPTVSNIKITGGALETCIPVVSEDVAFMFNDVNEKTFTTPAPARITIDHNLFSLIEIVTELKGNTDCMVFSHVQGSEDVKVQIFCDLDSPKCTVLEEAVSDADPDRLKCLSAFATLQVPFTLKGTDETFVCAVHSASFEPLKFLVEGDILQVGKLCMFAMTGIGNAGIRYICPAVEHL